MELPVLSDFPSDQERKLYLSALKRRNPPPPDPLYDPDPTRWGYLEPVGRKTSPTLDFRRENLGYNIVIDRRTGRADVVPGTMGNDHHFATIGNAAGRHSSIQFHFPSWDTQYKGWKIYRDGERLTLGNLDFILRDTYRPKPRLEGAFETYEEISDVDERRNGSFGTVAVVANRASGKVCALKIVRPKPALPGTTESPTFEISSLMALSHHNVCGIEGHFVCSDNTLHIIMEYAACGTLSELLVDPVQFAHPILSSSETAAAIMTQLCTAVAYVHAHGITHRDIKPTNIIVPCDDPCLLIQLADFGLANRTEAIFNDNERLICGNFEHMAPEMVKGDRYGNAVDIYSVGVIFHRLLLLTCGKTPTAEKRGQFESIRETVDRMVKKRRHLWNPPAEFRNVAHEGHNLDFPSAVGRFF